MDKINIISTHGNYNNQNNLIDSIQIFNKYSQIDMIEIDVINENDNFLVAHDYDNGGGTELNIWIFNMIKLKKYIWLDIKDKNILFTTFDIIKFDNYLSNLNQQINIKPWIYIGCQYKSLYYRLNECKFIKELNFIFDAIYAHHYVPKYLNIIEDKSYNKLIKQTILSDIYNNIFKTNIIALDITFFNDDDNIQKFIYEIPLNYKYIIIYSLDNVKKFLSNDNQKIIYMLKFYL